MSTYSPTPWITNDSPYYEGLCILYKSGEKRTQRLDPEKNGWFKPRDAKLIARSPRLLGLLAEGVSRVQDLEQSSEIATQDLLAWAQDAQEIIDQITK